MRRSSRAGRRARTSRAASALAAAACAALTASAAKADEAPPEREHGEAEVLVRGGASGGFVSRARVDDAPREVTDAASLVEPLPGVHVRRLGADDSFATLSVRGSSSTQVAVYLAGVPLSGGADPMLDLATLPLWPGAEARVHRTFAPAALGPGSLGGTLVIAPPSARGETRTDVWAAAGSFGSRRLRVGDVRETGGGVRVATGLSASRGDGGFDYFDMGKSGAGRDVFVRRQNAGHAAAAGLVSVAVPVAIGHDARGGALTVTGLAQARRQELPGSARQQTPYLTLESSRLVSAVELTLPASGTGAFGVRAWGRREGLSLRDDPEAARFNPSSSHDAIVAAGGGVGWRGRPTEDATVEVRVDGSGERFAPGTWVGIAAPPGARRARAGVSLDATARVADLVTLAASARGDAWVDSANGTGPAAEGRTEQRPTGHVGVELPIGPLVASAHGGFVARPPSFVERYGNRGAFLGNAQLASESAVAADAGVRLARRMGPVRLDVEASAFATWAEDLITFVPVGGGGRAKAMNIGQARLAGLEGALRARAFGVDVRASYTGLATANQSECLAPTRGCARPELPGRPAHDVVVDLALSRGPVRVRYGIDAVAGIYLDASNKIEVPARVLHGAGARLAIPHVPGLSLGADVRNLFDLRVATYPGATGPVRAPIGDLFDYPLPGRSVLFSARWTTPSAR